MHSTAQLVGASEGRQCTEWGLVRGGSAQLVGTSEGRQCTASGG